MVFAYLKLVIKMKEVENVIEVRVEVARELWALVKADATRTGKRVGEVLNEILKEHYGKGEEC